MTAPTPLTERQREQISKAADEIERRGLAHTTLADFSHGRSDDDCKVCTIGGLGVAYFDRVSTMLERAYASKGNDAYDPEWVELVTAVAARLPYRYDWGTGVLGTIYHWNDEQGVEPETRDLYRVRTTEYVVATLREMAAA